MSFGPTGQRFAQANGWPVGPIAGDRRVTVPQGVALGWENDWAFGPTMAAKPSE